ncbi:MAG: ribosome-binding factor A [bacterium]
METTRDEKVYDAIKKVAAEFLQRESNHMSLITVTDVKVSKDGKLATILITVLPVHKEPEAIAFLKRMRREFRDYFMSKIRMGRIPTFDFDIDRGEKHRQRIDELTVSN